MKTLKVNQIEKNRLTENEMNHLKGGESQDFCGCGCLWEGNTGSSTGQNASANAITGSKSPGGVYKEVIYRIPEVIIPGNK